MKFILDKIAITLMLLILILSGCGQEEKTETASHIDEKENEKHGEELQLSDSVIREFGIELATAGSGQLEINVSLPGEIIIPPDNLAHISPRFAGIVKKVNKHIGDRVKRGDVLAVLESNESLAEYQVKSLIDGTVIEKHFSLGEVVQGTEHSFVIADLRHVWAILNLYPKDIPYVKKGQKVIISAGSDTPESKGIINYISPVIDELTRTAEARVVLNNPKGFWKPGLFVTGSVATSTTTVDVLIPKTALETIDDETIVFVKDDDGFEPRHVSVGKRNHINVEITDGLKAGDVYVSKGGFTLKAELQKDEFGDDDD